MTQVAIFGAGQIGRAAANIIDHLRTSKLNNDNIRYFIIDNDSSILQAFDDTYQIDMEKISREDLTKLLIDRKTDYVINAMPFFMNKQIATAAYDASAGYIDFTEDDEMAAVVRTIYEGSMLNCAVKCGLAPGFINYIGHDLVSKIDTTDSLMISVGALPRTVSYDIMEPWGSYNLSWSVDGLVNEYIRPCDVRIDGKQQTVDPLTGLTTVILDGLEYESAYTSGGIGSLASELSDVPNVCYKTLRYPKHYEYVRNVIGRYSNNFLLIKQEFLDKFSFTTDDVIVVYATAKGKMNNGTKVVQSYFNKFYGVDGMTGIQSTTAGSGIAILELFISGKVQGTLSHSTVKLDLFTQTEAFKYYYKTGK